MGLDGVELVLAVEEEFGVSLMDEDLAKAVTPRRLGDLVFSKLQAADALACQSQRAFYILRRALVKTFGLKRRAVTLDLKLREFIAREREKEAWPALKDAVEARTWPALDYPAWLYRLRQILFLSLLCAGVALAVGAGAGWVAGVCGGLLLAGAAAFIEGRLTRPLKACVPSRFKTVRDVVPLVRTSDGVRWTREEVSVLLKQIVQEQLGVPDERYTEDSHFIDDFHMD